MGFVGGKGIRPAIIVCVCLWFSQFAFSDPPSLGVSGNLSFTYQIGGPAPGAGSLVVTNVSHGDMSWDASTDVSWASISPSSGSLPDTFDRGISSPASTVTVNVGGLAPGSYSGSQLASIRRHIARGFATQCSPDSHSIPESKIAVILCNSEF
jgi:hypothetical protein